MKVLNINALVLDERLQSRVKISQQTVDEYANDMRNGDKFPAVTAYFDGINYYLADGYHRYFANKAIEKVSIECEVTNGTLRDAIFFSTSANRYNGLRRTPEDLRKCVMVHLDDLEWEGYSNAAIARHCGVSAPFVANIRAEIGVVLDTVKYTSPSGKVMEKKKAVGRPKKVVEPLLKEAAPEPRSEQGDEAIGALLNENEELKTRVALVAMEATPEERQAASDLISELREELRVLNIEMIAVKQSRDSFQQENSQLKKQISSMQRQLKKAE